MLVPLTLPPGVFRNGTMLQSAGRWYDSQLVRWYEGQLRPIGGWEPVRTSAGAAVTVTGTPRAMLGWRGVDNTSWLAVGTHSNLFAYSAGALTDITPTGGITGDVDTVVVSGSGNYGSGVYGAGVYGAGDSSGVLREASMWHLDTFGDGTLVALHTRDRRLLSWDQNTANDAAPISGAPSNSRGLVVTEERFLFALGADNNVRRVRWADQGSLTTWTPTTTNTAGSYDLITHGRIVAGRRGRNQTLIWTDVDLHVANYLGGDFVYGFEKAGDNCGLIGPGAVAVIDGAAMWMGRAGFYVYDGFVKPIPCEVSDWVFGRLNATQGVKVTAVPFPEFGEVWWFFPCDSSLENCSYVIYNYRENHWAIGGMTRTAGVPRGAWPFPILATAAGALLEHERGTNRDGATYRAESGPVELQGGDQFLSILRIVPDERFLGDVNMTLFAKNYPTDAETTTGTLAVRAPTDCRISGRQVRVRYAQGASPDARIGTMRLDVKPRGRR